VSQALPNIADEQGHFEFRALLRKRKSEVENVLAGLNKRLPAAQDAARISGDELEVAEARLRKKEGDLDEVEQQIRSLRREGFSGRRAA
jgi:hypothetical protein